jgi:hypothetical protein
VTGDEKAGLRGLEMADSKFKSGGRRAGTSWGIGDGKFKIQDWRGPDEIGINSLAATSNRLVLLGIAMGRVKEYEGSMLTGKEV